MTEVEVFEISEEEYREIVRKALEKFKALPDWKDRLAVCHLKCSDYPDAHHLATLLSDPEVGELYREADMEPPL